MSDLILPIELVLKTSWWSNARSKMGDKWDEIRKDVYKKYNYQCCVCGNGGEIHAHEVWSYRDGIQKLEDIVAYCPACHKVAHIGYAKISGNFGPARERFIEINGLTDREADRLIRKAFAEWRERSRQEWELDLSLIETEW